MQDFLSYVKIKRCPICESQLDGNLNKLGASLYCVSNPEEYFVKYKAPSLEPEFEQLSHYMDQYEYLITISKNQFTNKYYTSIVKLDTTFPKNLRHHSKKVLLSEMEGRLTDFNRKLSKNDFEHLLNKIIIFSS